MRGALQDRGPEVRLFYSPNNLVLILAENHDENARRADRDPHGILYSPVDASALQAPTARSVEPLGSLTLLACCRRLSSRRRASQCGRRWRQ